MTKNSFAWWSWPTGFSCLVTLCAASVLAAVTDETYPTTFSNQGSIANTRHNMTQRQLSGGGPNGASMDPYRNNYGEVCVYCHTPHSANSNVTLPLWNRTIKATSYITYNELGTSTLTQPVSQPGPSSLSCLSCHDGQVAVDSIINMPGSGGYNAAQATGQIDTFLNAWTNTGGPDANVHVGLNPVVGVGCLACHSLRAGMVGAGAADFTVFAIGTDLRNDHPVGVRFPAIAPGVDFNPTTATRPSVQWFDLDGDKRLDPREIRLYDSGYGYAVECASCHDPHGVPSDRAGGLFNPAFLRISNAGSQLCLTCHIK